MYSVASRERNFREGEDEVDAAIPVGAAERAHRVWKCRTDPIFSQASTSIIFPHTKRKNEEQNHSRSTVPRIGSPDALGIGEAPAAIKTCAGRSSYKPCSRVAVSHH
jgi:hypothetical protein